MRTKLTSLACALALVTFAGAAHAHRPWLLPSSTFVDDKDTFITVDAAVSEQLFEFDHIPLRIEALTITGPDGAPRQAENVATGKRRTVFDLRLAQPGTYKLALVNNTTMATYKLGGEEKRWRGAEEAMAREIPAGATDVQVSRSVSRLESFVTSTKADFAVFKPANAGLEMVPVSHPNELHAGGTARMRFLIDGQPAANLPVSLVPGGVRYSGTIDELRATTDAKGEIAVKIADAGRYWLKAAWPVQPQGRAAPPARSLSYVATLEVLPQ